jgi:site-specific recombinase XerD
MASTSSVCACPLLVAALSRHREEQRALGMYDDEGFVFGTRNGTPMTMSNLRRAFQQLCKRAGLGSDWTTYELRHSFVSLVSDQLDDLVKVADLAGHVDTRITQGYRDAVRPSLPHAIDAWDRLLEQGAHPAPKTDAG